MRPRNQKQSHYEVMVSQAGDWKTVCVARTKASAVEEAEQYARLDRYEAVRVSHEWFDERKGLFMNQIEWSRRNENFKASPRRTPLVRRAGGVGAGDCSSMADLESWRTCQMLSQLKAKWLTARQITVSELMYNTKAFQQLDMQEGIRDKLINQVAAKLSAGDQPAPERIKQLHKLADHNSARLQLIRDRHRDHADSPADLVQFISDISHGADRMVRLMMVIADRFSTLTDSASKLGWLIKAFRERPAEWSWIAFDRYFTELSMQPDMCLTFAPTGLDGRHRNRGDKVVVLAGLINGKNLTGFDKELAIALRADRLPRLKLELTRFIEQERTQDGSLNDDDDIRAANSSLEARAEALLARRKGVVDDRKKDGQGGPAKPDKRSSWSRILQAAGRNGQSDPVTA